MRDNFVVHKFICIYFFFFKSNIFLKNHKKLKKKELKIDKQSFVQHLDMHITQIQSEILSVQEHFFFHNWNRMIFERKGRVNQLFQKTNFSEIPTKTIACCHLSDQNPSQMSSDIDVIKNNRAWEKAHYSLLLEFKLSTFFISRSKINQLRLIFRSSRIKKN